MPCSQDFSVHEDSRLEAGAYSYTFRNATIAPQVYPGTDLFLTVERPCTLQTLFKTHHVQNGTRCS